MYLQRWLVYLPSAWQQADGYAGVKHRVHEARDGREAAELGVTAQSHGALQQSPMDPTPPWDETMLVLSAIAIIDMSRNRPIIPYRSKFNSTNSYLHNGKIIGSATNLIDGHQHDNNDWEYAQDPADSIGPHRVHIIPVRSWFILNPVEYEDELQINKNNNMINKTLSLRNDLS